MISHQLAATLRPPISTDPPTGNRARFPAGHDRIPVVYVTCPPEGSPRKLAIEFVRFLDMRLRTRANVTDFADAVCQVFIDAPPTWSWWALPTATTAVGASDCL